MKESLETVNWLRKKGTKREIGGNEKDGDERNYQRFLSQINLWPSYSTYLIQRTRRMKRWNFCILLFYFLFVDKWLERWLDGKLVRWCINNSGMSVN